MCRGRKRDKWASPRIRDWQHKATQSAASEEIRSWENTYLEVTRNPRTVCRTHGRSSSCEGTDCARTPLPILNHHYLRTLSSNPLFVSNYPSPSFSSFEIILVWRDCILPSTTYTFQRFASRNRFASKTSHEDSDSRMRALERKNYLHYPRFSLISHFVNTKIISSARSAVR